MIRKEKWVFDMTRQGKGVLNDIKAQKVKCIDSLVSRPVTNTDTIILLWILLHRWN